MKALARRVPAWLISLAALAGLCAFLIWRLPSIPFVNDGHCDPWYVFGMFYMYPDALHWFPLTRQVSRLPEILPGFLLTTMFHGISADYILFFSSYIVSVVCLYEAVRRLISRTVAYLAAIFFATDCLIIATFATTFDAAATVFNVIALYFVALALTSPRTHIKFAAALASGASLGAAIHAHLGVAAFAFANYLIYIVWELLRDGPLRKRLLQISLSLALVACGVALATAAIGIIIVVAFHGSFFQAFNQFASIEGLSKTSAIFSDVGWARESATFGVLTVSGLLAIINLVALRRREKRATCTSAHGLIAISISVLVLIATLFYFNASGSFLLEYDYYFVNFSPYLAMIIFTPFALLEGQRGFRAPPYIALFFVGAIVSVSTKNYFLPWLYVVPTQALASLCCAVCIACIYSFLSLRPSSIGLLVYLVPVILMTVTIRPLQYGAIIWQFHSSQAFVARDSYVRIREGMAFLNDLRLVNPPKFWVDVDTTPGETIAFPRSYVWGSGDCLFEQFPHIDPARWATRGNDHFQPGDNVVVISALDNLPQKAATAFRRLQLSVKPLANMPIDYNGVRYAILVEHVTAQKLGSSLPGSTGWQRVVSSSTAPAMGAHLSMACPT